MQKKRTFYVRDKKTVWAYLEYDVVQAVFALHIRRDLDISNTSIQLYAYTSAGYYDLNPEMSLRWVQDRLIPPNRANIGDILREGGLTEYSEIGMIDLHKGRCVQDDLYLEEYFAEK